MNSPGGITARALRAVKWNYVGTVGRIVATFASQIVLARLLGPQTFGLFGYAFLTVTLVALVAEMGLRQALIQTPDLTDDVLAVACGRLLLAGGVASAAVYLGAELIAALAFSTPQAAPVVRAMSLSLVVGAGVAAATAVLSRDIEFKVIQLAGLAAYVLAYLVIGVVAAYLELGVWSLVLAWYSFLGLSFVLMVAYGPRRLRIGNPFRALSLTGFGNVTMLTNVVNWFIDSTAHVIVGRAFGAAWLGRFTVAHNLVKVPADHLVRNLQSVLLPLTARARDNRAGLQRAYLTTVGAIGLIVMPTFTFIAVLAHPIVMLLLGPRWEEAAVLLTPLSVAVIVHAVESLCGPMLSGLGDPRVELRVKIGTLVAMLVTLVLTAQWSIVAVAWGLTGVFVLRWVWMSAALMTRLHVTLREYLLASRGAALLALVAGGIAAAALLARGAWAPGLSEVVFLAASAAAAAGAIAVLLFVAPEAVLGGHVLQLVGRLFASRPGLASRWPLDRLAASAQRSAS